MEAEARIKNKGICLVPAIENDLVVIAKEIGVGFEVK